MHGKGKILLGVSETSSRLNVKHMWIHRIENWKNICVFGIKRTCRRDRNWFALHSSNLSWVSYYISPWWIDISLLIITSKHLRVRSPFEVPELQVHCEMDCIVEQLIELQSRQLWSLTQF